MLSLQFNITREIVIITNVCFVKHFQPLTRFLNLSFNKNKIPQ